MNKKLKSLILIFILIILSVGCGKKEPNENPSAQKKEEDVVEKESPEKVSSSIVGTYIGDSREWILEIYDDNFLLMDDAAGEYQTLNDNEWIFVINDFAFDLKATFTDEGNLYITSDHSNWSAEMFRKKEFTKTSNIDLADIIGKEWDKSQKLFNDEELDNFEVVEKYEDGTFDVQNSSGTYLEIDGDNKLVFAVISNFESNYSIFDVRIGEDIEEVKITLKKKGYDFKESLDYTNVSSKYDTETSFVNQKTEEVLRVLSRKGLVRYISIFYI